MSLDASAMQLDERGGTPQGARGNEAEGGRFEPDQSPEMPVSRKRRK